MEPAELLKQAANTIREFAETREEKTASEPGYYLDIDELRSLANADTE